jgi:hypothetical protein
VIWIWKEVFVMYLQRSNAESPTCVFCRCFGNATKLELAVPEERSESGVIYELWCTKYLAGRFMRGNPENAREEDT